MSRLRAGYTRTIPEGAGRFHLSSIVVSAATRFPPAESPTITIFLGFI